MSISATQVSYPHFSAPGGRGVSCRTKSEVQFLIRKRKLNFAFPESTFCAINLGPEALFPDFWSCRRETHFVFVRIRMLTNAHKETDFMFF